jgi:NAD(P)-dependent dehydrogenase (short-subunit alcohol dehydrogenase family)
VRVLVAGAAGGVGAAIVRALLAADAEVLGVSRSRERLDVLRASLNPKLDGAFTPIVADAGNFEGAQTLADTVAAAGAIDAAVASLGRGWWTSGPTIGIGATEWRTILDEMLTSHFAFARAVVPLLAARPHARYLSIGGGAAFEPMPDAGLISVAAAAQAMLTRVFASEHHGPPEFLELVINGSVNTPEVRATADPHWITDDEVGRVAAELVTSGATSWPATDRRGPLVVMHSIRG